MKKYKTKKRKLIKFLFKQIPGIIPWIGNIWKDAVDEFTESDIDKALKRIEGFQKMDRETQRKALVEILLLRKDIRASKDIILRILQRIQRMGMVRNLAYFDIGNSRFLSRLQEYDDSIALRFNITREFRDKYLEMLENMFKTNKVGSPPFAFEMTDAVVAFPDGYGKYASRIRKPELQRPSDPVLITNARKVNEDGVYYIESGARIQIPWLPIQNGFIQDIDKGVGIVNRVGDEPSEEYFGAYYWVRPSGLRIMVTGIGILDPLECQFGTAIWWQPEDRSPLLGARPSMVPTEDVKRQMCEATVRAYADMVKKYASLRQKKRKKRRRIRRD